VSADNWYVTPAGIVYSVVDGNTGYNCKVTGNSAATSTYGIVLNVGGQGLANTGLYIDSANTTAGKNAHGILINTPVKATGNYSLNCRSTADVFFGGNVGVQVAAPANPLEVNGNTVLRGALSVTGNITSTGTAHSFVAKSIPASAISGAFTITGPKTVASQTETGAAGEFAWDANYLYGCIAANDWRRIPWTDWQGNTLPGSGAGATDTALPATFDGIPGAVIAVNNYTPNGKIQMNLGTTVPPLAIGIKVQYRIHGGNWVDATINSYWYSYNPPVTGPTAYTKAADFLAMKSATATTRSVLINGPTPGTPYITRMAWVSSLGTGLWTSEYTAVTPTA
jgi:hypothetical protein